MLYDDPLFVDDDRLAFKNLPLWGGTLHRAAQFSCLPVEIGPGSDADHGDDGQQGHREQDPQDQNDCAQNQRWKIS